MLAELAIIGGVVSGDGGDGETESVRKKPVIGVGLDCCVIPLRCGGGDLQLVQTTDFFYPLIDDPYTMGRIACCNVLSDLYAMGIDQCDNMLMLMGVSSAMTEAERKIAVPLLMRGFQECAAEAGTSIQGGQTVMNPWLLIGGVATAVCYKEDVIMPSKAVAGDVLVLTKALGTQVAVNAYQWMCDKAPRYERIRGIVTDGDIDALFETATLQMATLNKRGATLMRKYGAHACTDITGFGLLGHLRNLVECQDESVDFVIEKLPCLRHSMAIDTTLEGAMKLRIGLSPETSGGLAIVMNEKAAEGMLGEMRAEGGDAWIIGRVEHGSRRATIVDGAEIIEV